MVGALSFKLFEPLTYLINAGLKYFQYILNWLSDFPGMIHFGETTVNFDPSIICGIFICYFSRYIFKIMENISFIVCNYWGIIHFPFNGEVTFVDIGQGDSIIIREPFNRRVTMIDTGGKLNFKSRIGRIQSTPKMMPNE